MAWSETGFVPARDSALISVAPLCFNLYNKFMARIDITHLSPQERLDLIGELWDSLDVDTVPLTSAQAAELGRRRSTLDADIENGDDAHDVIAELRSRHS